MYDEIGDFCSHPHLGVDLLGRGWLAGVTAAVCCVMSPLIQRHECSCTCTRYR
eukprot:COSAG04_NODE_32585_length_215_cov_11395.913793_1_plen_52_part_01